MYIVKNIKAVNSLVRAGFDLMGLEQDKFNPNKMVFKFEDTKELGCLGLNIAINIEK